MAILEKRIGQMVGARGRVTTRPQLSRLFAPALEIAHPGSAYAEDRYREVPITLSGRNGL